MDAALVWIARDQGASLSPPHRLALVALVNSAIAQPPPDVHRLNLHDESRRASFWADALKVLHLALGEGVGAAGGDKPGQGARPSERSSERSSERASLRFRSGNESLRR